MHNWSVDIERFKKEDPEGFKVWKLEQLINYGLNDEKIDKELLMKYWDKIYIEDPFRKEFLELLLWGKNS